MRRSNDYGMEPSKPPVTPGDTLRVVLLVCVLGSVRTATGERSRSLGAVHGPLCYNCHGIQDPGACTDIKICSVGEVCMVHRLTSSSGAYSYEVSCQSEMMCNIIGQMQMQQIGKRDDTTCHVCCTQDFCNNKCGANPPPSPTPDPRLTCYSCSSLDDPGSCRHHVTCQLGQMCVVRETGISAQGTKQYLSSCEDQAVCTALSQISASYSGDPRHSICFTCCTSNLCNNHCDSHQSTTPVTSQPVPTSPPTTTTHGQNGVRCYQCDTMGSPNDCTRLVTCAAGEVCTLFEIQGNNGNVKQYKTACEEKSICEQYARLLDQHFGRGQFCKVCCDTDACNTDCNRDPPTHVPTTPSHGATPTDSSSRQLRCFNCDSTNDPNVCTSTTMCGQGEVCMLIEHSSSDPRIWQFSSSCQPATVCSHYENTVQLASKETGHPLCHVCCTQDLCNRGCSHMILPTHSTTSSVTTIPAPTPPHPTGNHGVLMCYSCTQMASPTACQHAVPCVPGEVCMIQEIDSGPTGSSHYETSCVAKSLCQTYSVLAATGVSGCHTCCETQLCNSHCHDNPVTTVPVPTHSAPTHVVGGRLECYSCNIMHQPDGCSRTQICDYGQVCMLHETSSSVNGLMSYKASCERTQVCETVARLTNQESSGHGHVFCTLCCATPRCNNQCSRASNAQTTTGIPSTTSTKPVPVDGAWSSWIQWSGCSRTCGEGHQSRIRTCDHPVPQNGGAYCHGNNAEQRACTMTHCPVDGGWSDWSHWGNCDVTCGHQGNRQRSRSCSHPAPQHGGKGCVGHLTDSQHCTPPPCPVDGGWSDWGQWGYCDVTCGHQGNQQRSRSCSHPAPQYGGKNCAGSLTDTQHCTPPPCPVDGAWSDWEAWSHCSTSCGIGTQQRSRSCTNPKPQYHGHDCVGDSVTQQSCKLQECPIDGSWADWTGWSSCTVSCGPGGQHIRTRSCTNPPPQHGGRPCSGDTVQLQACQSISCSATQAPNHGQLECYSCPIIHDPTGCAQTEVCEPNEVCMLHETTSSLTNDKTYRASCERKLICERVVTLTQGASSSNGHVFCTHCCNTSLCNNQCVGATSAVTSHAPPTSHLTPEALCQLLGYSYVNSEGFCFKIYENSHVHAECLRKCSEDGGTLAIIDSEVKWKLVEFEITLRTRVKGQSVYIGGYDRKNNGVYTWPDGTVFGYNKWASGQPVHMQNNHMMPCVVISGSDLTWKTDDCQSSRPFICSKHVA